MLVICLSALPMLAPSASAAGDVVPLGTSGGGRGYVAITFDDGLREIYDNAAPVMEAAGIPGTAFITTDWIGGTDPKGRPVMTAEEILDLQDRGWEIGSHGVSHAKLSEIPYEDAVDELVNSTAALENIGIDCTSFAFPHSAGNSITYDAAWDTYERLRCGTEDIRSYNVYGANEVGQLEAAKELIDQAFETDGVCVFFYHFCDEDGYLYPDINIRDLVDYLVEKRDQGMQVVRFRDLPPLVPSLDRYVWDGEGATELASDPMNWRLVTGDGTVTNNVLPADGAQVVFRHDSARNCTWDLDPSTCSPWSIRITGGYGGTITQSGVDINIGPGGYRQASGTFVTDSSRYVHSDGDVFLGANIEISSDNRWVMTGDGSLFRAVHVIGLVWVQADIDIRATVTRGLWVDAGCTATLIQNLMVNVYSRPSGGTYGLDNRGTIAGDAGLTLAAHDKADLCHNLGRIATPLRLTATEESSSSPVYVMPSDAVLEDVRITSPGDVHVIVDLSGNTMATSSIYLDHGHIGNGTLITSSWDSTAGTILDGTSLILSDGGSAVLAPGQAFDRLEIASDDGRTASWTMTATGAQAPIVTGLKSGSYLWYLDGVEQGEVKAGKDGTIALSYTSTGLHTLEVQPTSMTAAMDGLAAAIGIIVALAVLGGVLGMLGKAFGRLKF